MSPTCRIFSTIQSQVYPFRSARPAAQAEQLRGLRALGVQGLPLGGAAVHAAAALDAEARGGLDLPLGQRGTSERMETGRFGHRLVAGRGGPMF